MSLYCSISSGRLPPGVCVAARSGRESSGDSVFHGSSPDTLRVEALSRARQHGRARFDGDEHGTRPRFRVRGAAVQEEKGGARGEESPGGGARGAASLMAASRGTTAAVGGGRKTGAAGTTATTAAESVVARSAGSSARGGAWVSLQQPAAVSRKPRSEPSALSTGATAQHDVGSVAAGIGGIGRPVKLQTRVGAAGATEAPTRRDSTVYRVNKRHFIDLSYHPGTTNSSHQRFGCGVSAISSR